MVRKGMLVKEKRKCLICKKTYIAKKINSKYCGESCAQQAYAEKSKENDKNKREREAKKKQAIEASQKSLSDYAAAARAAGMSYGKYQEQMTLQRMARSH